MMRLYLNTAIATIILFGLLSLWGASHAVRNRALTMRYRQALMVSHVPLFALVCDFIGLHATGQLARAMVLPLVYYLVAFATIPCVWLYTSDQSARGKAFSLMLACVFTGMMVVRALQTGIAHP